LPGLQPVRTNPARMMKGFKPGDRVETVGLNQLTLPGLYRHGGTFVRYSNLTKRVGLVRDDCGEEYFIPIRHLRKVDVEIK